MSATRDPDRLFQAFLDEGPEVLPDRVLEAVADDIHGERQRTVFGPWRFPTMRNLMAAAAVLAIVVAGGGILWANSNSLAGTTPSPTTPSPTTPSPNPTDPPPSGMLLPDERYFASAFGEPFRFRIPMSSQRQGEIWGSQIQGDIWDTHSFRLRPDMDSGGAITIHDDVRLMNDICHPTGAIQDVPPSIDAVGEWLEASDGLTVSSGPAGALYTVDNAGYIRLPAARRWDIELGPNCYQGDEPPPGEPVVWFQAGEHHRVYAIETDNRDDVIVMFTWGAGYGGDGDEVLDELNVFTDRLVDSIDFDGPTFSYE